MGTNVAEYNARRAKIKELYLAGKQYKEIAAETGLASATISKHIMLLRVRGELSPSRYTEEAIKRYEKCKYIPGSFHWTESQENEIREMLDDGKNAATIALSLADRFGKSRAACEQHVRYMIRVRGARVKQILANDGSLEPIGTAELADRMTERVGKWKLFTDTDLGKWASMGADEYAAAWRYITAGGPEAMDIICRFLAHYTLPPNIPPQEKADFKRRAMNWKKFLNNLILEKQGKAKGGAPNESRNQDG